MARTARYSWGFETTKPTVELSALRGFGGEGVVHLLPSEPISVLTTVIPMVAGIEFDVKGVFVTTVSTPAMLHLNPSIKAPLHTSPEASVEGLWEPYSSPIPRHKKPTQTASPAPHSLSSAVPLPALKHSRRGRGPLPPSAVLYMCSATD
jgi:hypothetical protein